MRTMTSFVKKTFWIVLGLIVVTGSAVAARGREMLMPVGTPLGDDTLAYDDGSLKTWWCSDKDSFGVAVRFTPREYPCEVTGALAVMHYDMASHIWLRAFDDDGDSGLPGTVLANKLCTGVPHNADSSFRYYELALPLTITSGDFYLCLWQTAYFNLVFASDQRMDSMSRQLWYFPDQGWVRPSGLDRADHLIRARVSYNSGIEEVIGSSRNARELEWTLNPNPVENGFVTLNCNLPDPGPVRIVIYDAAGRPVDERAFDNRGADELKLDVHDIPNGLYFLRLESGSLVGTRKLIIRNQK
jgi:hypothetical protein